MIKMVEFDEGTWVPEECCTMTNPATSGGASVPDDVEMPCEGSASCTGECNECVIQRLMNDYAKCTGQAGRDEKDIEETINNDAYLNSCNCPVCGKKISRGDDERTFYCEQCGTRLHQRAFTKKEIAEAIFEKEMDEYEDN